MRSINQINPMIEKIMIVFLTFLTLFLAVLFGLLDKPTEMGIIVGAGAVNLAFLNIDKIQRFKGVGIEAEMKQAVKEAHATIEQLREVAATSSKAILTGLMADNFFDGITLEKRLDLHDQLIQNLKEIGASKQQIKNADEMWMKGIPIIFFRGIQNAVKGEVKPNPLNTEAEKNILEVSRELTDQLQFEEWKVPSSSELREFLHHKQITNPEVEKLLDDYSYFETTGKFRRRNVFITL